MGIDLSRKEILVIDDFTQFRRTIKKILRKYGADNIDEAATGSAAVKAMSQKRYDIVVSDYNLGGAEEKNGQQILEEVRGLDYVGPSTIYIMLTAESSKEMIMGAAEYAPDGYIIKPFPEELLIKRLEKLMEVKSAFSAIENVLSKKEFSKAIELCDQQIKDTPKNLLPLLELKGEICLTTGHYEKAKDVFDNVLAMRNISWAKHGLGKISFIQGDYDQAKKILTELIGENEAYVKAYDLLAETEKQLGDLAEAKRILMLATQCSPKTISRQRTLGHVSIETGDNQIAERSFRKVVELGKNSYLKKPEDYSALAMLYLKKKATMEAFKVTEELEKEFENNPLASLQASLVKSSAFKQMGRNSEAKKHLKKATDLFDGLSEKVSANIAIDLARNCYELGEKETGTKLMKEIVGNDHDNNELLDQVRSVFMENNLFEEGEKILSAAIEDVRKINKEGINLLKKHQYIEAIDYFKNAAAKLTKNKILNANVAHAILLHLQETSKNKEMLDMAWKYLERVKENDPNYERYYRLIRIYEEITSS